ncbi:MAG: IS66 family transposase [Verrucomicrobia bacterium]|nr:IS66 family transposase [Verrucomicrobiota bacterium]
MADSKPPRDANHLPDNLNDCHSLIKELFARIAELEKQLSRRNRAVFGRKSAKVNASLLTGTGKSVHDQTTEELSAEKERLNIVAENKHGGGRSAIPENLVARKKEHRLAPNEIACPCCGQPREIIGFDVSHQIEFVQTLFEAIQHIMFKYACKKCSGQIVTAHKPYQPIDKGLPGPGLLAKIATDKFWLHLPLYRQEQVLTALSIPIDRSSMCRWLRQIAELLSPIVRRMSQLILRGRVIQSDATTLPVIKKGLGKTHRGFVWVYRGDVDYPYVFYDYSDTEHSIYPERILKGFTGILQTDGTNKYNDIIANGATAANCWAHVHCYFEDAWKADPKSAELPMGIIKSLFDIERVAATLPALERKDLRQRLAKPKIEKLKSWLEEAKFVELPKSKLGGAIAYTLNRWPALLVYLDFPFVEISNNGSERSIKPLVLSRRNWLFAGSEEGGHTAATLMSLIETCKRLRINPFEYMKDVLTRFPSAKTSQIDDFLPDRWLQLRRTELPSG